MTCTSLLQGTASLTSSNGLASKCFEALIQLSAKNSANHDLSDSISSSSSWKLGKDEEELANSISGPAIGIRFAEAAYENLSSDEMTELLRFLQTCRDSIPDRRELESNMQKTVEDFYRDEIAISGQDENRLTKPGGPADAFLGLILHHQSEDDVNREFWNYRSVTIDLLQEKGMCGRSTFGFDWHWRAQGDFRGGGPCPVTKWSPELRALHDNTSLKLLDILPLPFVLTGSACTRANLQKHLTNEANSFKIRLDPCDIILSFDFDFRNGVLRRVLLHVHHPVTGFLSFPNNRLVRGAQVDAGINFMLWLSGIDYEPLVLTRRIRSSKFPRHIEKHAPLGEMWSYIHREESEGRTLQLEEYPAGFRLWAKRFLKRDPELILAAGESIAGAAAKPIRAKLRQTRINHYASSKAIIAQRSELLGRILKGHDQSRSWVDEGRNPTSSNEMCGDSLQSNVFLTASEVDAFNLRTCQGSEVKVVASGMVTVIGSEHRLRFRLTHNQAQEIQSAEGTPKIFVSLTDIQIRDGDKVLYTKPIERLLLSQHHAEWQLQLMLEHQIIRQASCTEKNQAFQPHSNLRVPLQKYQREKGFKRGEVRRQLEQGDFFHCPETKNKGHVLYRRVYIRGIQIMIPLEADPETVFIQTALAPVGFDHPNKCHHDCEAGSPARRLAFKIQYKTQSEEKVYYHTFKGATNLELLNSLVELLES